MGSEISHAEGAREPVWLGRLITGSPKACRGETPNQEGPSVREWCVSAGHSRIEAKPAKREFEELRC